MRKLPAGRTTISGQCGQSRKTVSGGVCTVAGGAMDGPAMHPARVSAAADGTRVVTVSSRVTRRLPGPAE